MVFRDFNFFYESESEYVASYGQIGWERSPNDGYGPKMIEIVEGTNLIRRPVTGGESFWVVELDFYFFGGVFGLYHFLANLLLNVNRLLTSDVISCIHPT